MVVVDFEGLAYDIRAEPMLWTLEDLRLAVADEAMSQRILDVAEWRFTKDGKPVEGELRALMDLGVTATSRLTVERQAASVRPGHAVAPAPVTAKRDEVVTVRFDRMIDLDDEARRRPGAEPTRLRADAVDRELQFFPFHLRDAVGPALHGAVAELLAGGRNMKKRTQEKTLRFAGGYLARVELHD